MTPEEDLSRALRIASVEFQEEILEQALREIEVALFLKGTLEKVNKTIDSPVAAERKERRYFLGAKQKWIERKKHMVHVVEVVDHLRNGASKTGVLVKAVEVNIMDEEGMYDQPQGLFDMADCVAVNGLISNLSARVHADLPDLDVSGLRSIAPPRA